MKKVLLLVLASGLLLSGCAPASETVTLVAHDSFAISDEAIAQFEKDSGYQLEIIRAGDAGSLTNRLVLTKNAPIADLVFGIDNTFESVATEAGIIDGELTAIDYADVCFNYDRYWFAENNIAPPTSWRKLTDKKYRGLTVVSNPLSSSPGLAFLATTVSALGDSYIDYWKALKENDVLVAGGWEDAYFTYFSGSSGKGKYPIVLSYSSSPAAEIREDGKSQTEALLGECFRQIEYAGVIKDAANPAGAKKLLEFLLSPTFQDSVAELMYVYPIDPEAMIPTEWSNFGQPAKSTIGSELDISGSRQKWQQSWSEIFG
ncbi:MAG: thiamine ABC transporter substrate binding subunit [Actinomycetota bacterium]